MKFDIFVVIFIIDSSLCLITIVNSIKSLNYF